MALWPTMAAPQANLWMELSGVLLKSAHILTTCKGSDSHRHVSQIRLWMILEFCGTWEMGLLVTMNYGIRIVGRGTTVHS